MGHCSQQTRLTYRKSQRTPIPLLRSLLSSPGLTLLGSKFALKALSGLSGLAEADHKLPASPWSSKLSFQLPENAPLNGTPCRYRSLYPGQRADRDEALAAIPLKNWSHDHHGSSGYRLLHTPI